MSEPGCEGISIASPTMTSESPIRISAWATLPSGVFIRYDSSAPKAFFMNSTARPALAMFR